MLEFGRRFPDEAAASEYVLRSRWPEGTGFVCPKCGHHEGVARADRLAVQCASRKCRSYTTATAGTAMHRSKMPLTSWLLAAWLLVTDKRGISSVQLAAQLGTTQETAYMMLHRLRAAMVAPERSLLAGRVEVDETYIGAKKRGRADAETLDKILVVGAVELRDREYRTKKGEDKVATWPGRIRLRHIMGRTALELQGFVLDSVGKGSHVVTDGLREYDDLDKAGYLHEIQSTSFGDDQEAVLPHLHTVFSNLKAYLKGTYHGAVSGKHIQAYLNEYAFRFNRRRNPQAAFQTILGIATRVRGPEYQELYADAGEPGGWEHPGGLGGGLEPAV